MATAAELIPDPLFQQNVVLWIAQEVPPSADIKPVLGAHGFAVFAVERRLSLSAPIVSALTTKSIEANHSAVPDVLLLRGEGEPDGEMLVVECKRSSFGSGSSTARQARAIMLASGSDAAAIAGVGDELAGTLVSYLVPDGQADLMSETLSELAKEMGAQALDHGDSTVLALTESGIGGTVDLVVGSMASAFVGLDEGRHTVLRFPDSTDPRPLYFFPYDPGVHQTEEERARCSLDLRKRLHQRLVSQVGRARSPADFSLDLDALLDGAYFGLYALWDNREAKNHLRQFARRLVHKVAQVVQRTAPGVLTHDERQWRVQIGDEETHRVAMNALLRFDPETQEEEDLTLADAVDS